MSCNLFGCGWIADGFLIPQYATVQQQQRWEAYHERDAVPETDTATEKVQQKQSGVPFDLHETLLYRCMLLLAAISWAPHVPYQFVYGEALAMMGSSTYRPDA